MRNFSLLDESKNDPASGIFTLHCRTERDDRPEFAMKIEGEFVAISASYGAFEIALRPKLEELRWALSHVVPFDGLQTTSRQIGSTQAFLALGLRTDGTLILRPTILADATGHFTLNLMVSSEVRAQLYAWLGVTPKS